MIRSETFALYCLFWAALEGRWRGAEFPCCGTNIWLLIVSHWSSTRPSVRRAGGRVLCLHVDVRALALFVCSTPSGTILHRIRHELHSASLHSPGKTKRRDGWRLRSVVPQFMISLFFSIIDPIRHLDFVLKAAKVAPEWWLVVILTVARIFSLVRPLLGHPYHPRREGSLILWRAGPSAHILVQVLQRRRGLPWRHWQRWPPRHAYHEPVDWACSSFHPHVKNAARHTHRRDNDKDNDNCRPSNQKNGVPRGDQQACWNAATPSITSNTI